MAAIEVTVMRGFQHRLSEALESALVEPEAFLRFAGAIATSTALEKIPLALERARQLPPRQLAQIIGQVQYTGDLAGLKNAVASKPGYAVALAEVARRVLPEEQVQEVLQAITPEQRHSDPDGVEEGETCPDCRQGTLVDDGDELRCNKCGAEAIDCCGCGEGPYMMSSLDEDGQCAQCGGEIEDPYHPDTDYYTQGEDPNAH